MVATCNGGLEPRVWPINEFCAALGCLPNIQIWIALSYLIFELPPQENIDIQGLNLSHSRRWSIWELGLCRSHTPRSLSQFVKRMFFATVIPINPAGPLAFNARYMLCGYDTTWT